MGPELPSIVAWAEFYEGPVYQGLKAVSDECSSAKLVSVEGLALSTTALSDLDFLFERTAFTRR